jgi:hypothetical protein
LAVLAVRARAWRSPTPDYPDRFLMLLGAVIVILNIRNGFVLGSFFVKLCVSNGLQENGAIFFLCSSLFPAGPVCSSTRLGGTALSAANFSNASSRTFLINPAVDCIHLEHQGALFPVRSHALITHCHENNLTLQP